MLELLRCVDGPERILLVCCCMASCHHHTHICQRRYRRMRHCRRMCPRRRLCESLGLRLMHRSDNWLMRSGVVVALVIFVVYVRGAIAIEVVVFAYLSSLLAPPSSVCALTAGSAALGDVCEGFVGGR